MLEKNNCPAGPKNECRSSLFTEVSVWYCSGLARGAVQRVADIVEGKDGRSS